MDNQYVVGSKDVKINITLPNIPSIQIDTATAINFNWSRTVQDIFAIGFEDPIATTGINSNYTATLSFQTGEYQIIMDAINAKLPAGTAPYASLNQLPSFTISKTMYMRNTAVPKTITESLLGAVIESNNSDTNRNEAETLTSLTVRGRSVTRTVTPLTF